MRDIGSGGRRLLLETLALQWDGNFFILSRQVVSCPRFLWTPYCPEKLEDRQDGR